MTNGITSSHRLIKALLRQPVDRIPIWLMRQAGRYLPEYRRLREQYPNFLTLCQTPELACRITLMPLLRFPLDAAILFSDILVIPHAMGQELYFEEQRGPRFQTPISNKKQIKELIEPDPSVRLRYVLDAIKMIKTELSGRTPLIGFAGSPWTLATYMIEGGHEASFSKIRKCIYDDPSLLEELLTKLTHATVNYLNAQIQAGVDAIMLFDTWGGILTHDKYLKFSLKYISQIFSQIDRNFSGKSIPIVLFAKGCNHRLELIVESGCDAIGIDWTMELSEARKIVRDRVALQGNLDPVVLLSNPKSVVQEVRYVLDSFGKGNGFVFNLGHGIDKDTPLENVQAMVDTLLSYGNVNN